MKRNQREVGQRYETKAIEYLKSQGYQVIECNFRCRKGEIDIIAKDGEYLVFCEVKYRKTINKGTPGEAVTTQKMKRISQTAVYYMYKKGLQDIPCRFDVVSILGNQITVYKNAFEYVQSY